MPHPTNNRPISKTNNGDHRGSLHLTGQLPAKTGLGVNELLSSAPADGATIAPGAQLSLTFAQPLRNITQVAQLIHLNRAQELYGTWTLTPGTSATYLFTPAKPLQTGQLYRLVVFIQGLEATDVEFAATWQMANAKFPVIDFHTTGDADVIDADVWASPFQLSEQNPNGGIPEFSFDDRQLLTFGSSPVRLHLNGRVAYDFGRTPSMVGHIEYSDGSLVANSEFAVPFDAEWIDVVVPLAPQENQRYRVVLPPVFDRNGRVLQDRLVYFTTGLFPLRVTTVTPPTGSSVAPPVTIDIRVNRPDRTSTWDASTFVVKELDTGINLPFALTSSPYLFTLTPSTPLVSGTRYQVLSLATGSPVVLSTFTVL